MTFTNRADPNEAAWPDWYGVWSTDGPVTHDHFETARPLLAAARDRGETVCWVGSQRWTWTGTPGPRTAPRPTIDAELLGRAIREHRQAEFDPHAVISMTHLCFDDCAENIAARYDELASR